VHSVPNIDTKQPAYLVEFNEKRTYLLSRTANVDLTVTMGSYVSFRDSLY
jgi:hypothetical protein